MFEDFKTFLWYLFRPKLYSVLIDLILRKYTLKDRDGIDEKEVALKWYEEKSTPIIEVYQQLGIKKDESFTSAAGSQYFNEVNQKIRESNSNFGGSGDLDLLYNICEGLQLTSVIETGVAYGWTSSAILHSISNRNGFLISVDIPMPKQDDYHLIGSAVKSEHKKYWKVINKPDKYGLLKAIKEMNKPIDLIHYDSDKSYYGRKWAHPIMLKHLADNGIFVIDDIQDNIFFKEFVEANNYPFWVIKSGKKFVGIIKKFLPSL